MKTLIVISDSHGNLKAVEKLRPLVAENDAVVHLGDGAGDMRGIMREFPEKTYLCGGNKCHNTFGHTKTCTEDRYKCELSA